MKKPKAILFDWDNTLVSSWFIIHKALNQTFKFYNRPLWTLEDVKKNAHRSARESFPILFGNEWTHALQVFYENIAQIPLSELSTLPYAQHLLNFFYDHVLMGVVSNKKSFNLHQEINHLKWDTYFSVIVGSGDALRDKPAPDPLLLALKKISLSPSEEIWFIGDTNVDIECAQSAGCFPIAIFNKNKKDVLYCKDLKALQEVYEKT